jgi:hypothetical protein
MPTAKPRVQVTFTTAQYELLKRLAELQDRSMGSIITELFEQVHPVLERVAVVLQAAARAQVSAMDGLRTATEAAEAEVRPMVDEAMRQLDLLHVAAKGPAPVGEAGGTPAPRPALTPEPVTRGSGMGVQPHSGRARAIRRGSESTRKAASKAKRGVKR